jgi:hypothetical protein
MSKQLTRSMHILALITPRNNLKIAGEHPQVVLNEKHGCDSLIAAFLCHAYLTKATRLLLQQLGESGSDDNACIDTNLFQRGQRRQGGQRQCRRVSCSSAKIPLTNP